MNTNMNTHLNRTTTLAAVTARPINATFAVAQPLEILIRAEGLVLTEKLRDAVNLKIGRARRYAPRAVRARVLLQQVRASGPDQFRAGVHYEIPGNDIVAEHTAHDPLTAIDLVADKLERRLRRRKTARLARRLRTHRNTPERGEAFARARTRHEMEASHV